MLFDCAQPFIYGLFQGLPGCILRALDPPLANFAIFSVRGGGGPWGLHRREVTPPPGVSNDTPVSGPLASFSYCGDDGKGPASWFGPKRASDLHGAEQCGQRPLPSRTCLPSCTPHTEDVHEGTASWPYARQLRSLFRRRSSLPLCAMFCGDHSTSVLTEPVQHSRDACTEP